MASSLWECSLMFLGLTGAILHGRGGWRGLVTPFHHNFPTSHCETSLILRANSTLFSEALPSWSAVYYTALPHKWNSIIRCLAWRPQDRLFTLAINLMESFFFCVSGAWQEMTDNCTKPLHFFQYASLLINTEFYMKYKNAKLTSTPCHIWLFYLDICIIFGPLPNKSNLRAERFDYASYSVSDLFFQRSTGCFGEEY